MLYAVSFKRSMCWVLREFPARRTQPRATNGAHASVVEPHVERCGRRLVGTLVCMVSAVRVHTLQGARRHTPTTVAGVTVSVLCPTFRCVPIVPVIVPFNDSCFGTLDGQPFWRQRLRLEVFEDRARRGLACQHGRRAAAVHRPVHQQSGSPFFVARALPGQEAAQ